MKAVRLVEIGRALQLQDIPIPAVGAKDVLVRVRAAGICHSDVHYRAGTSPVGPLPQTLGHEIAGIVEDAGSEVTNVAIGDRVCLHYLLTCGQCYYCHTGNEQFCVEGKMLGKHCDGGYAEFIAVPARNAVSLPDAVSFEQGAALMCSSSTSFHALRKARLQPGETVAIFGAGGLGMSAIQLARTFGALVVYAVDINEAKLRLAQVYGAVPIDASQGDPVAELRRLTGGRGVDVTLEVIGLRRTMEQAVQSLAILGRAVMVGIADQSFAIDSYSQLLGKEAEVIGSADHLLSELPVLVEFVRQGRLDLSQVVTRTVPLEASAINQAMDALAQFGGEVRTVIMP
jgi:2-desacetyl-2-hydroxyethyl bacteriochlorophyllide A dehydrogenase